MRSAPRGAHRLLLPWGRSAPQTPRGYLNKEIASLVPDQVASQIEQTAQLGDGFDQADALEYSEQTPASRPAG